MGCRQTTPVFPGIPILISRRWDSNAFWHSHDVMGDFQGPSMSWQTFWADYHFWGTNSFQCTSSLLLLWNQLERSPMLSRMPVWALSFSCYLYGASDFSFHGKRPTKINAFRAWKFLPNSTLKNYVWICREHNIMFLLAKAGDFPWSGSLFSTE